MVNTGTGGSAFSKLSYCRVFSCGSYQPHLLGAQYMSASDNLNIFDYIGIAFWIIGFTFEAGGDFQLAKFKKNPANKGKVLDTGFWKYTRHPNYFGDSAVWWGFGFISIAAGSYIPVLGSIINDSINY